MIYTPFSIINTERKNKTVREKKKFWKKGDKEEDVRRAKNFLYGKRPGKWQMINRGEG